MILDGIDRFWRVATVEDVDAILVIMLETPVEERGVRFWDEIDMILDGRLKVEAWQRDISKG